MISRHLNNRLILPLICLLASCTGLNNNYSAFSDVDSDGWKYGQTYLYRPSVTDSIADGTLRVAVVHNNDYPYRNLWLEVTYQVEAPDSTITFHADTVNMQLADAYGNWLGTGQGNTYQKADTVRTDFHLVSGSPVRLRHIMRTENLEGLSKVGIIFEKQ